VKDFALSVAKVLEHRDPARYTASVAKKARDHRIYVDYLRNTRGATAVAAYSPRARKGAPVSTPLSWDELTGELGPAHFTVSNLIQRLRHLKADPWAGLDEVQQKLPKPLALGTGQRRETRRAAGRGRTVRGT
jgi:bifunctional non-homologous end joining protein LigD